MFQPEVALTPNGTRRVVNLHFRVTYARREGRGGVAYHATMEDITTLYQLVEVLLASDHR